MNYRIHIQKFAPRFYSFHTPKKHYPSLPVRTLVENSLVAGIDKMLETEIEDLQKVDLIMSDEELSIEYLNSIKLVWISGDREDSKKGGNWYKNNSGKEGWLCEVLFDYFSPCPIELFIYVVDHNKSTDRITFKQKIEELKIHAMNKGYAELIPIDDNDNSIK